MAGGGGEDEEGSWLEELGEAGCHPEGIQQGPEDKGLVRIHTSSLGKLLELEDGGWGSMKRRERKRARGGERSLSQDAWLF